MIDLKNKKIFITGGTGFLGLWLLKNFVKFYDELDLKVELFVLSRNPEKFLSTHPQFKSYKNIIFIKGDIRNFEFFRKRIDYIIHGALPADYMQIKPLELLDIGISGTRRVLDFAKYCQVEKFLFISSGVVYGKQPLEIEKIPETASFGEIEYNPGDPKFYYIETKRIGEVLCWAAQKENKIPVVITRCFSFIGPFMPLNSHFAAGNFIRDALKGGPIIIKSDGTKITSYMYVSDFAQWIWAILFKSKIGEIYNIGSEKKITLKELAQKIAEIYKKLTGKTLEIIIKKKPEFKKMPEKYIPSTQKVRKELGLKETIRLEDAIEKTFRFYQTFQGAFPEFHKDSK